MDALIKYLESGNSISELFTAMLVVAGVIVCIEKFLKWIYGIFLKLYRKKRGEEDELATIDKNTTEIKNLAENIERLGALLNKQYQHLNDKIDEQKDRLTEIDNAGKQRDCSIFRDRLIQGMRYFGQNKDENDVVHISMADYENMNSMFTEYFKAGGNGTIKHIYETEFSKFKIDNNN